MTAQICDSTFSAILDLLASVHRDGGQYTADHGIEKSCHDAEIEFYRLSRMLPFCMDLDERLSRNEDATTIGEWINAYWTIANMRAHLERIKR